MTKNRQALEGERLQKVLAAAGLASRRDCEEWILQGRVEVDGQVVAELGTRVDPERQQIRVDGVTLAKPRREYLLFNKPPNVLCTNFDPSGRTRVIDLIPSHERLFTVGRLDRASEGLILVTNDGELAHRLMHPRFEVEKTYQVRVAGVPSDEVLVRLRKGIRLAEGWAKVAHLTVRKRHRLCTDMEIVLKEGKNREIRRILAKVGHKVMWLKRTALGPLRLADLVVGETRRLSAAEVQALRDASSGIRTKKNPKEKASGPRKAQSTRQSGSSTPGKVVASSAIQRAPDDASVHGGVLRTGEAEAYPTLDGEVADWERELLEGAPEAPADDLRTDRRRADRPGGAKKAPPIKKGPFLGSVLGYEGDAPGEGKGGGKRRGGPPKRSKGGDNDRRGRRPGKRHKRR